MLPKEPDRQGLPEKSSDWTCIENSVRGVPLAGGAEELPRARTAIAAAVEERCVGAHLLSRGCACERGGEGKAKWERAMIGARLPACDVANARLYAGAIPLDRCH